MRYLWTFIFFSSLCYAQTGVIRGIVTDKDTGDPLPGVNVALKQTTKGASSDADGRFIIFNVPPGTYDLELSFIGFKENNNHRNLILAAGDSLYIEAQLKKIYFEPFNSFSLVNPISRYHTFHQSGYFENAFLDIQSRPYSLLSAEFPEYELSSITDGQAFYYRDSDTEEQLFYLNEMKLNDPFTSRVNFRLPSLFTYQGATIADGVDMHSLGQAGGKIFLKEAERHSRPFHLYAVSSEVSDDYGYNDISGKYSFENENTAGFAGLSYIRASDHTPSPIGLVVPSSGLNESALPGNNSELLSGIVSLEMLMGDWRGELSSLAANRESRRYIPEFAKNNTEHFPLTKNLDWQSQLKLETRKANWQIEGQIGFRHVGKKTGDGVWFDDLEAYGDVDRNAERGIILPEPGVNLPGDSLGIFSAQGRIYDYFQKSQSRTLTAKLDYWYALSAFHIRTGANLERHQLRYYDIQPLMLARAEEDEKDLFRMMAVGRYYGYDLYGNDLNTTRFSELEPLMGQTPLEESAAKTPRTIGSYLTLQTFGEGWDAVFSLRYDNFDPATERLRSSVNFYGNGSDPFFLDPEDFEEAPTEHLFSPQFMFNWNGLHNDILTLSAQITHQISPLMFYYDSWNNLQYRPSSEDRFDFLNTGRIKPERYDRIDLSYARQFSRLYLRGNVSWNRLHRQIVRATVLQEIGQRFYRGTQLVNSDSKSEAYGITVDGLYEIRGQLDTRLSYSALYRPDAAPLLLQDGNMLREESRKWQHNLTAHFSIELWRLNSINKNPFMMSIFRQSRFGLQVRYQRGYNELINSPSRSIRQDVERYLDGSFGGNLKPFLQLDMQISRMFDVAGSEIKPFLSIENLLNRTNFYAAYFQTGQPDSDGREEQFRIGPNGDQRVQEYQALVNDPNNYARPRTIRLGLSVEY